MSSMYELELEHELEGELEHELEHELELELEGELEGEFEGGFLGSLIQGVGSLLGEGELEFELEHELEGDGEFELEHELNPVRKVYLDAMLEMEHMANAAAESESENEAEQFFPLLLPLAAKLAPMALKMAPKILGKVLPQVGRAVNKVAPRLMKGISGIGKKLHRSPRTRPLVRTLPTIVRKTVGTISRQAAKGRPVTPATAQRILQSNARRVLADKHACARAIQRSRAADRKFHKRQLKTCRCTSPAVRRVRPMLPPRRPSCPTCKR